MKRIAAALVTTLLSLQVLASGSPSREAYDLAASINLFQPTMKAISDVSSIKWSTPDERTEKDLTLCMIIGGSQEGTGEILQASSHLIGAISDATDRKALDENSFYLIRARGLLTNYCVHRDDNSFRSDAFVTDSLAEMRTKLDQLLQIARKYNPAP